AAGRDQHLVGRQQHDQQRVHPHGQGRQDHRRHPCDLHPPQEVTLLRQVLISMTYTHGHHESVLRSHKWRTVDNSAAYLAPHLTDGISVLDLGCGPGTITADIGRRVAPGRVLGIDMSSGVIEEARRDAGAGSNVEFSVGDLYSLDIDADTFDVVHAHQVLQHLADPVGALRQMKRVCKRGGLVAARDGDYGAFRWYPDEPAIDRWLALYRTIARRNAGEPDAGRFLLAWAHAAGFDEVRPGASVW